MPTTILSVMRIDFINTDLVTCRAVTNPILYTDCYTPRIASSDWMCIIYNFVYIHPQLPKFTCISSILSRLDNLLNRIQLQQFPPTRPPVSKQFWLFFICRPETFVATTVASLSVQSDNTNPPVLHHVTLLDQSKLHNHSSI